MSAIVLGPFSPAGAVAAEPSKSFTHRLLIASALAGGISSVSPISANLDIAATLRALTSLGYARIDRSDGGARVTGGLTADGPGDPVDCGESGSTLRFLLPIAAARSGAVFTGKGRLLSRPLGPLARVFGQSGVSFSQDGARVTVSGGLKPGRYAMPGDISSQFVTGMLMALPLLPGDSELSLETALESAAYVDITLRVLAACGIRIERHADRSFVIPGRQRYLPGDRSVPGDWSHAAFFLAMGALAGPVDVTGLSADDVQGDRAMLPILRSMGCPVSWRGGALRARRGAVIPVDLDARDTPDLVPAIAAVACGARGVSRIRGVGRLRLKESDRIESIAHALGAIGGDVDARDGGIVIRGVGRLAGGRADAHGDHRIAMMLASAATLCDAPITLTGWDSVRKSAPSFWEDYAALGGKLDGGEEVRWAASGETR